MPQGLPVSTSEWHKWLVGIVYADVEVERDRGPRARVRFLVDSGAAYPFDRTLGPMRLTLASVPARAGYP